MMIYLYWKRTGNKIKSSASARKGTEGKGLPEREYHQREINHRSDKVNCLELTVPLFLALFTVYLIDISYSTITNTALAKCVLNKCIYPLYFPFYCCSFFLENMRYTAYNKKHITLGGCKGD